MNRTKFIDFKIILKFLGQGFLLVCFLQLISMLISLLFNDGMFLVFLISSLISFVMGMILLLANKNTFNQRLTLREGFVMIVFQWILVPFLGMIPFYFGIPHFTIIDALFESYAGFTTTGFTLIFDKHAISQSLVFWKSVIQWIGGMGLIMFLIALLPFTREGEYKIFFLDLQDVSYEPIHPNLTESARRLWYIYSFFTVVSTIALYVSGLDWFNALCYSLSTVSTGGGITQNGNVTEFSFYTKIVLAFIMLIAGVNYLKVYRFFVFRHIDFKNEEFKWYLLLIVLCFTIIISIQSMFFGFNSSAIFETIFNVISISSTTGIYVEWSNLSMIPFVWLIIFLMMFIGSSTGSTGGGINLFRIIILFRTIRNYVNTLIHPQTYYATKFNNRIVSIQAIRRIYAFFQIFLIFFFIGSLLLALTGLDLIDSMVFCIASISNIGPGAFLISDVQTFANMTNASKMVLSALMIIGRIEIFPLIILLSRSMWIK